MKFIYTNGTIKDMSSGKCLIPTNLNNTVLVKAFYGCSNSNSTFEHTENYSIKHLKSGKCLQPLNGSPRPQENTPLLLNHGCGENWLRFYMQKGEHRLVSYMIIYFDSSITFSAQVYLFLIISNS